MKSKTEYIDSLIEGYMIEKNDIKGLKQYKQKKHKVLNNNGKSSFIMMALLTCIFETLFILIGLAIHL